MTTIQELIALAATIARDLDAMAVLPADRITHIAFGSADDTAQRQIYTLGEGFEHPSAELQAAFAATAAWLRDELPALAVERAGRIADVDDDEYERLYPEQVSEVLGTKLQVDGDVVAYWRTSELAAVLAATDLNVMFTLAQTFAVAWEDFLSGDERHLESQLRLASDRAGRHDVESIEQQLRVLSRRDDIVRAAIAANISKNRVHTLTGIARTTIDRILAAQDAD